MSETRPESVPVMKLPFEQNPCLCVSVHRPTPLEVEKHHPWPQSDQIKKHGRVIDNTTIPLCDIAHKNVHIALARRLKGDDFKLGNRYQEGVVQQGLVKILGDKV